VYITSPQFLHLPNLKCRLKGNVDKAKQWCCTQCECR